MTPRYSQVDLLDEASVSKTRVTSSRVVLVPPGRPQEVDQRGVCAGLRVQNEANKKLIRDVIMSRAACCHPCQDLSYFAG